MAVEFRSGGSQPGVKNKLPMPKTAGNPKVLSEAEKRKEREAQRRALAAQRLAGATAELSSGVQQAKAAVVTLDAAMTSIASAATQSAAAAEQSLKSSKIIESGANEATKAALTSLEKGTSLQTLVGSMSVDIGKLIDGVSAAAEANLKSAQLITSLEESAVEVSNIVQSVVQIADQTNLLAFNAAIEAARAGKHGLGFAVVADEVRTLAETSAVSAMQIRELVATIQTDVKQVADDVTAIGKASAAEVEKAKQITSDLQQIESGMSYVVEGSQEVQLLASEMARAAGELRAGSQQIATASEQAATATREASASVNEQSKALGEIASAAEDLAQMSEELRHSNEGGKAGQELSSAAQELSATIQQSNAAAQQIMAAVQQISSAAQQQSSAAQQSLAGAREIETVSSKTLERAKRSEEYTLDANRRLTDNKVGVENMIIAIQHAAEQNLEAAKNIKQLQVRTRQIDKIVDAIVNVTIQTNLLALNGAIEAARAGKHGKGFAVVAGDVRTLAKESAEAADKIKTVVRDIQDQVVQVARDVEQAGQNARQQVEEAKRSTANLVLVERNIAIVYQGIQAISGTSQNALDRVQESLTAIDQIAKGADAIASATLDASTSSEQNAQGMQELARAVEEIANTADQLFAAR